MNRYKNLFLQQSYSDNLNLYYELLKTDNKETSRFWDYVILSASNVAQAAAFTAQIEERQKEGRLPICTHFAVVPDPDGKRVGSGGATLNILKYIHDIDLRPLKDLKILLLHSGGDAKRTPQYSACGKIFSPVPRMLPDGYRSTLFDEFMITMCGIPSRIKSGMLTCSGDVELLFNPLQLDFYGEGAAAFSIKEPVEVGKDHGVFLGEANDNGSECYVKKFLHKQTVRSLNENGAVDKFGLVNIDTGAILFSGQMTEDLYSLVNSEEKWQEFVNDHVRLSFYADFLYPLATDSTLQEFYGEVPEGEYSAELNKCRKTVWKILHKYKLKLIRFAPAAFLHFGTTHEVRKLVCDDIDNYYYLGWTKSVNSNYRGNKFAVSNSYISTRAKVGKGSYIEDSYIHHNVNIGDNCVISGLTLGKTSLSKSAQQEAAIDIPSNTVLHGLKLKSGKFVVRAYGVADNPKDEKWFGKSLNEPLWTKKLFSVCDSIGEAVDNTLDLLNKFNCNPEEALQSLNQKGNFLSLQSSFNEADVLQILPWQKKLNDRIEEESLLEAIDNHISVKEAVSIFKTGVSSRVEKWLLERAEESDFSQKIRIYYYLSQISGVQDGEKLLNKCFDTIKDIILTSLPSNNDDYLRIVKDEVIVRLPVRVNWGGGWSDTPPYCLEHGGTVLNAALQLNGKDPIEVTIRRIPDFKIVLESTDIGTYGEFTEINDLQNCTNPSDPFALHKAALLACRVIPSGKSEKSVEDLCRSLGGGIYMNTRVINIPKGSGLGTSSILAAACVKALYEFFGNAASEKDISTTVLCMEQIMSTGGGWQDQVGGLVPGIKMVTADAGFSQNIVYAPLKLKKETLKELNNRFALIYTGQRRLARNLLRDIVGKYIGNDQETVNILYRIQQLAVLMRMELVKGHINGFANLLNDHWELSKKLDGGCTNTCIDQMINSIDDLISGKMICGAGGGGFIQVILKKGVSKELLQERLDEVFGESGVGVWECEII